MAGKISKQPMPRKEEYTNPEDELRKKIEEQKARVDAQAGAAGSESERYNRLRYGKLPMPQKPEEEPSTAESGATASNVPSSGGENPEDYEMVNSPTEGVFLKNKKTGTQMSLMDASQIPGFEDLVSKGTVANQTLLKKGLEKK